MPKKVNFIQSGGTIESDKNTQYPPQPIVYFSQTENLEKLPTQTATEEIIKDNSLENEIEIKFDRFDELLDSQHLVLEENHKKLRHVYEELRDSDDEVMFLSTGTSALKPIRDLFAEWRKEDNLNKTIILVSSMVPAINGDPGKRLEDNEVKSRDKGSDAYENIMDALSIAAGKPVGYSTITQNRLDELDKDQVLVVSRGQIFEEYHEFAKDTAELSFSLITKVVTEENKEGPMNTRGLSNSL
jgi:hypothetical protein